MSSMRHILLSFFAFLLFFTLLPRSHALGGAEVAAGLSKTILAGKVAAVGGLMSVPLAFMALESEKPLVCNTSQIMVQSAPPNTNGCGTAHMEKLMQGDLIDVLTPCCVGHDYAYSTCGASKDHSDATFGYCSQSICSDYFDNPVVYQKVLSTFRSSDRSKSMNFFTKVMRVDLTGDRIKDGENCRSVAKKMHDAVTNLGQSAFVKSQNQICACKSPASLIAKQEYTWRMNLNNMLNIVYAGTLSGKNIINQWSTMFGTLFYTPPNQ